MDTLVCTNVYVPLRIGPSHKAEMGSQILMGERYEVVDTVGSYSKIKLQFDGYSGWIDNDHISASPVTSSMKPAILANDIDATIKDGSTIRLVAGSEIIDLKKDLCGFSVGNIEFRSANPVNISPLKERIELTALAYLNTPYLWGGRTSMGMDCSGLVQTVYKVHGIGIPRDSFNQAEAGKTINLLSEAVPGDLLFFDNSAGKINHVGMFYKPGEIIHCSGRVRIDMIDHQGIYRNDERRYTHKLRTIKRFF